MPVYRIKKYKLIDNVPHYRRSPVEDWKKCSDYQLKILEAKRTGIYESIIQIKEDLQFIKDKLQ